MIPKDLLKELKDAESAGLLAIFDGVAMISDSEYSDVPENSSLLIELRHTNNQEDTKARTDKLMQYIKKKWPIGLLIKTNIDKPHIVIIKYISDTPEGIVFNTRYGTVTVRNPFVKSASNPNPYFKKVSVKELL